ncbi:hypothetical protein EK403_09555 [Hansschlegelia zhihuaiae]|uniref:Uncharacterized protein n=2 Tax=Hansschlegelia zhihuaiae TaxID=405005 RepID=A0A4Q0MIT6_9HYPH|nr:hypothetical protein EK403_09555 [Hansschlegelia zhihuaiae]
MQGKSTLTPWRRIISATCEWRINDLWEKEMARSGVKGALLVLAVVLCSGTAHAERYRYTAINVPGSVDTKAMFVNAARQVAGSYTDSDGKVRTFRYADGTTRKYYAPRPNRNENIVPTAIGPTGLVVGTYTADGNLLPFILRPLADGVEGLAFPDSEGEHDITPTAVSNNEKEDVAGYFTVSDGTIRAFNTQAGFTQLTVQIVPGASATKTMAFAQDQIHGFEVPAGVFVTDQQHGYLASSTNTIDPPGSVNTSLTYLNNGVSPDYEYGGYAEGKGGKLFGWVRRGKTFTKYRYPGAVNTKVTRHLGEDVFGEYTDKAGKTHGFQYRGGKYYQVQPKYAEVTLTGVSEDGSFTGYFLGDDGRYHGYLATCDAGPGQCVTGKSEAKPESAGQELADAR